MSRRARMARLAPALVALALAGCDIGFSQQVPLVQSNCSTDADCPGNEVCLDIGCAAPDQNLVIQVVPPQDRTDLSTQDFADVNDSQGIVLSLGPPGSLHLTSSLYPFTLTFAGSPRHIPDLPYSLSPVTVTGETRLPLAVGEYSILATPSDPIVPPLRVTANIDAPGGSLEVPLQFLEPSELVHLEGALRAPWLATSDARGYAVQVLHDDQTPASQAATTASDVDAGADGLAFSLYVAPTSGETLRLVAWPVGGTIGPSVTVGGTLEELQRTLGQDGGISLGGAAPVAAMGTVLDPAGAPVAGAQVQLVADLPGQARFTSPVVTTDDGGVFQAPCLHDPASPGGESYQVLVVPPSASNLATALATPQAGWDGGGPHDFGALVLARPTEVTGRVLDSAGEPVAGADVEATPSASNALPLRAASATTDAEGVYHLALSPGLYHFAFSPPLALQAPSTARGPLQIEGAALSLPDVRFSAARVASGAVFDASGLGVDRALVRVYLVLPGAGGSAGSGARSTLLATGVTLGDGSFSVVLPTSPAPAD